MKIENSSLITLSRITELITDFFISRGFKEVETPLIIPAPVPEPHIDLLKKDGGFLRPSPEIEMKILLSEGYEKIFQIGSCFRKGEVGRYHREQFTMLEWYEAEADYKDLINFTKEMLLFLTENLLDSHKIPFNDNIIDITSDWEIMTIREAFAKFAWITPSEAIDQDIFESTLVEKIEPALPKDRPVILKDYPAEFAALARLKNNDRTVSERWELYLGGIEIANTYSELIDPEENKIRFAKFAKQREEMNKETIPVNEDFFEALRKGIPESSGCALGVERLAMIVNGINNIKYVI